jgi:hypothetical protein
MFRFLGLKRATIQSDNNQTEHLPSFDKNRSLSKGIANNLSDPFIKETINEKETAKHAAAWKVRYSRY